MGNAVFGDLATGEQRQPRILQDVPPEQSEQGRGKRDKRDRDQRVGVPTAKSLQPRRDRRRAKARRVLGRAPLSLRILRKSAQLGEVVKMALTAGFT